MGYRFGDGRNKMRSSPAVSSKSAGISATTQRAIGKCSCLYDRVRRGAVGWQQRTAHPAATIRSRNRLGPERMVRKRDMDTS